MLAANPYIALDGRSRQRSDIALMSKQLPLLRANRGQQAPQTCFWADRHRQPFLARIASATAAKHVTNRPSAWEDSRLL
jgi:hypothetical protein